MDEKVIAESFQKGYLEGLKDEGERTKELVDRLKDICLRIGVMSDPYSRDVSGMIEKELAKYLEEG